VSAEFDQVSRA